MKLNLFKSLILGACVAGAALAGPARGRVAERPAGVPVRWVEFVSASAVDDSVQATLYGPQARPAPAVVIETNRYAYTAADQNVSVTLTYSDRGFGAPVTLYLYRVDRLTGARTYFNLPSAGSTSTAALDLFGGSGAPTLVRFPELDGFVLFGTGGAIGPARADGLSAGQYAYVAEVRDAFGKRILAQSWAMFSVVNQVVQVTADVTSNTTWTADNAYYLNKAAVFVRSGSTLTIQPGTFIIGSEAQKAAFVVERGARVVAEGTSLRPIVFTSEHETGDRARGQWGGLIINGRAPINRPGGEGQGEGDTGAFGGNDPNDDSGVFKYVRVEYAGILFSDDNELNGIALQGVGRGTTIDHVQVHMNQDDGIEFFGGTVDAKYVLLTNIRDDSMDWVDGWQGRAQFVVGIQRGDDADQGIEADNKENANDLEPRSNPTIYNITLIGAPSGGSAESDDAVLLREGTAAKIHNGIFAYFNETHVAIRNAATFTQAANGNLVVDNNIFWSNKEEWDTASGAIDAQGQQTRTFITETMKNNRIANPELVAPLAVRPDVRPMASSPALDAMYVKTPPEDGFFDTNVFYIGGVDPYYNWTLEPWTTWSQD